MEQVNPRAHLYENQRDDMPATHVFSSHNNHCFPHFHSSIELVYVHSGELVAMLDGETFTVQEGQMLLVSSYTVHTYRTETQNDVTVIIIPMSVVPSLHKAMRDNVFSCSVYDTRANAHLHALLPLVCNDWCALHPETQRGLSYALLGMLISGAGLSPRSADSKSLGVIKDVLIYLQSNYQLPLSLETLSQQFGYSKSRFSHLFNETLGCSPGAFINSLRCQHAARAMIESEQTLLEIAMNAGFECPRTFYRAFKQYYGLTPTQYIRAQSGRSVSQAVDAP